SWRTRPFAFPPMPPISWGWRTAAGWRPAPGPTSRCWTRNCRCSRSTCKEERLMSRMLAEAREAPQVVARQMAQDQDRYRALGARLRQQPPSSLLTIARGSSDHAAHFAAYLVMARLGRLVASMPMSLLTLYHSQIRCDGLASLAFSQSGQSPDLVGPTQYFRNCGALTCAFINDAASPLARSAEWLFPLHAGEERSVAATKSFIAQLVAGARVVASWQDDDALAAA